MGIKTKQKKKQYRISYLSKASSESAAGKGSSEGDIGFTLLISHHFQSLSLFRRNGKYKTKNLKSNTSTYMKKEEGKGQKENENKVPRKK